MINQIKECRICKNKILIPIIELGEQSLTGVFPNDLNNVISKGPLNLVKCMDSDDCCGLVQLQHSYNVNEMFGLNYGYQSSLNSSMVEHLHNKVNYIKNKIQLNNDDLIIDIGSNDGTTLKMYSKENFNLVGIDPTGSKFSHLYEKHILLISDFFSSKIIKNKFPNKKAKVITSFSMFYDLENPLEFMKEIYDVIHDDGIWVFEQSYMPTMLNKNSFDTICHEHLEYYALHQIKWMTDKIGFTIIDVEFNDINGGSFSVTVQKTNPKVKVHPIVQEILNKEIQDGMNTIKPYKSFKDRIVKLKLELIKLIHHIKSENKTISVIGASTKGNVLLQYCELNNELIDFIGEVNKDKFGCYSPGTNIPIIPEDMLLKKLPDYLLVLPWHFKDFLLIWKVLQDLI